MKTNKSTKAELATVNNKTTKVKKMNKEEIEMKRQLVLEKTEEIKKNYQAINKMESNINLKTYEVGKALETIVNDKSFKLLTNAKSEKYNFSTYCEEKLGFSNKYAYMLINAAKLQDVLERESLTEVKQGHHQLRKLCKYMEQLEVLKVIWNKAANGDKKAVLNIADLCNAIKEMESNDEKSIDKDPVESAYNSILKWGNLKKLTVDQRNELLERLNQFMKNIEDSAEQEND